MSKNSVTPASKGSKQNTHNDADELISEGVHEFKTAAAKTATGIIEQGLAVLKIKQGCDIKQGGTNFPDVAMRELGLSESMASYLLSIGSQSEKLLTVVNSLPSESVTTIAAIGRMDEATIADKIERGVITPTATRDQVQEKVRVQKSVPSNSLEDSKGDTVADVYKNLAKKDQKILDAHVKSVVARAFNEAKRQAREEIAQAQAERARLQEERAAVEKARRMVSDPFTEEEYKIILGALHPDRHEACGMKDRAAKAWTLFMRLENVCKKRSAA